MVLPLMVALVRLLTVDAVPVPTSRTPSPFDVLVLVVLVNVLPVIVALLIVPALPSAWMPLSNALVSTLLVTESVPLMLFPVSAPLPLKAMLDSPIASPELLIVPFANVKFVTPVPLIPAPPVLWMFMLVNDGLVVLFSETPWPVVCWIVPPELSPPDVALPLPLMVKPAADPVPLSTTPLAGPLAAVPAEMLRNLRPLEPILVFVTFSVVPVPVSIVFGLAPVGTLIVPPPSAGADAVSPPPLVVSMSRPPPVRLTVGPDPVPVEEKAAPVPVLSVLVVPEKSKVPPLLADMSMPPPSSLLSLMLPARATVPLLRLLIWTDRPLPIDDDRRALRAGTGARLGRPFLSPRTPGPAESSSTVSRVTPPPRRCPG